MKTPTLRSLGLGIFATGFAAFATSCMDSYHAHSDRNHHIGKPSYQQWPTYQESTHSHSGNQLGKVPGNKPGTENYTSTRN